jgi:hypothetical protein
MDGVARPAEPQIGLGHDGRPDAGLRAGAAAKLARVEQKISDLQVIRDTLRAALRAGCDDLVACAAEPDCPLPFAELASDGSTGPGGPAPAGAGPRRGNGPAQSPV